MGSSFNNSARVTPASTWLRTDSTCASMLCGVSP
jgi:hypothetical protein